MARPSANKRPNDPFPSRTPELRLEASAVPHAWFANDPYATAHMIALSLSFPGGEQFFVDSVRFFRDKITDSRLRTDVATFFGQETMHGREHASFNRMLREKGFDRNGDVEAGLLTGIRWMRARFSPEAQLAYTAAVEHWTAVMGERLLTSVPLQQKLDPSVRSLWMWHCLEETEHKAVAFDVYQEVSGHYGLRVGMMVIASLIFVSLGAVAHPQLLRDGNWKPSLGERLRGVRHMAGRGGLFEGFARDYVRYFKPGFHPNDKDTRALVAVWRERLFGEGAPLENTRAAWPGGAPA